jgi:predicted TIM-barrel fold metal-dependent hydrolase
LFVREFGVERVLFGSDWPWGCQETPLRLVEQAADGDKAIEEAVFSGNAAKIMKGINK